MVLARQKESPASGISPGVFPGWLGSSRQRAQMALGDCGGSLRSRIWICARRRGILQRQFTSNLLTMGGSKPLHQYSKPTSALGAVDDEIAHPKGRTGAVPLGANDFGASAAGDRLRLSTSFQRIGWLLRHALPLSPDARPTSRNRKSPGPRDRPTDCTNGQATAGRRVAEAASSGDADGVDVLRSVPSVRERQRRCLQRAVTGTP